MAERLGTGQDLSWLRVVRDYRVVSQATLAERAGISQVAVSHLENGHTRPKLATARALAKALKVEPDVIFPAEGAPSPMDVLAEHAGLDRKITRREKR